MSKLSETFLNITPIDKILALALDGAVIMSLTIGIIAAADLVT